MRIWSVVGTRRRYGEAVRKRGGRELWFSLL